MKKKQEPKYHCTNGALVNRETDRPISEDEPVMIFRGQDKHAVSVLEYYQKLCKDANHRDSVDERIKAFKEFAREHHGRMKEPDSATVYA